MTKRSSFSLVVAISLMLNLLSASPLFAQRTLGGLTGVITDNQGGILTGAVVTLVGDQTGLKRTQTSGSNGFYDFVNLPIGTYTLSISKDGFESQKMLAIPIQSDRTATVNVELKVGAVNTVVSVDAVPLMNAVDTTNGYVLDKAQIQSIPLPTGSFTGLAIMSPGVNAELSGGTGTPLRPWERSHLGQRSARYQQQLFAQRRRREQSLQR